MAVAALKSAQVFQSVAILPLSQATEPLPAGMFGTDTDRTQKRVILPQ